MPYEMTIMLFPTLSFLNYATLIHNCKWADSRPYSGPTMSRRSRLSPDDLNEIKKLYSEGIERDVIREVLRGRGIILHPTTISYHLELRKKKKGPKSYLGYVRDDCKRRGVPYTNPRARDKKLWS
jgi:hypothetical protein